MNKHKLLVVLAHPDDESFGPGGTIAKYAKEGAEVYLVTATKGEAGQLHPELIDEFGDFRGGMGAWREQELRQAAQILGVKELTFLGYQDGTLCQNMFDSLTIDIMKQILHIKPQVVVTFEPLGISKHLDHIAVSNATTMAFYGAGNPSFLNSCSLTKQKPYQALKLYHYSVPQSYLEKMGMKLRSGYPDEKITTIIDVNKVFATKIEAIKSHRSQKKDWERFLSRQEKVELKYEFYYRAESFIGGFNGKETDLFEGVDNPKRLNKEYMMEMDNLTLR